MPNYRAYIFGREGHRFAIVAEFARDHADDSTAQQLNSSFMDTASSCGMAAGWLLGSIIRPAIRAMISHG
jgi:hypothetical protein